MTKKEIVKKIVRYIKKHGRFNTYGEYPVDTYIELKAGDFINFLKTI